MTLAEKLTQARKAAGLTQADSAEKLNVSRQAVSLWELSLIPISLRYILDL